MSGARAKVKICGMMRPEDIEAANVYKPDFIGFVMAESRRRVSTEEAAELKKLLSPEIKAVGVFVNEEPEIAADIYNRGIIDIVQLHGDEDDEYTARLKSICGCEVIKAVPVGDSLPELPLMPDYLLFDSLSAERGGTGKAFDWDILKDYRGKPFFLAGGLSSENVREALGRLAPYCADVSSGVDTDRIKDPQKIKNFINAIRGNQG